MIEKYIESFSVTIPKFPLIVCTTWRLTLKEHEKGDKKRPLPNMPDYENMQLQVHTRQSDNVTITCNCYVCSTTRSKLRNKTEKGRGKQRKSNIKITKENGLYGALKINN